MSVALAFVVAIGLAAIIRALYDVAVGLVDGDGDMAEVLPGLLRVVLVVAAGIGAMFLLRIDDLFRADVWETVVLGAAGGGLAEVIRGYRSHDG